jgi:hypothetical protein
MRWPVVLAVLLLGLALSAEGKKKICPVDKVNTKQFQAYTGELALCHCADSKSLPRDHQGER